ncbi:MAG: threonine ammonia-lyase [Firmicutes bacterium]|nr:threonine ammonia-lyase [Bacillota bacterium]
MALTLNQFQEAKIRLQNIITETRLLNSTPFSQESGHTIFLKPENLQVTGSFKIRGAYNKIAKLSADQRKNGLIASSAGNHAQGVAYAAQKLGVKATIVMPKTAPLIKVEATKSYGAHVILAGDCYDDAFAKASQKQKEENYLFVHPYNDLDVIEGQGTIALEIIQEMADIDYILAPIGGGGLISGVAMAAKAINPDIKVIGVEPDGAQSMKLSLEQNRIINLERCDTIADGVAIKNPGDITFPIIKEVVDDIITVTDYEILEAFLILLDKHKLVGESSGVLTLAAINKLKAKNKKVVCIISGGNIDMLNIVSMINRGLISRGRIFCFSVNLPDKPGQLLTIYKILATENANVIKLNHNQFKTLSRVDEVQLEVTAETNGHQHIQSIITELENAGYQITKIC